MTVLWLKGREPRSTDVYDLFWSFAAERQRIFFKQVEQQPGPLTDDPILSRFRFTNTYRAADRTTQYLIRRVIYGDRFDANELAFRILLFKTFNKIETWQLLERELGDIRLRDFSFRAYDQILSNASSAGLALYSAAYILPSGKTDFGSDRKHRNHLSLLRLMLDRNIGKELCRAKSLAEVYRFLLSFPTIGPFLAFQYSIDLNYSPLTEFSEMDFVIPGPGAKSGMRKCFSDSGSYSEAAIIEYVTDRQEKEFEARGLKFKSLWGRPLQLIDVQNIFCEVDKYSRVYYPDVTGLGHRTKIKRLYRPHGDSIQYFFPPKWGLNANGVTSASSQRILEKADASGPTSGPK